MGFGRRQTVPMTTAIDRRNRGISRRGMLKTGLAASASLLVRPVRAAAQDATPVTGLSDEQRGWLERASRNDVNGWVHLKIEGAPFERGFQHGYLVAAEYADALRVYEAMTYQTMGFDYSFFVDKAVEFHKSKITPELTEEMEGIAAGLSAAGVPTTFDDIIGWNAYMEITGYWWPTV
ncbi:MAG: peptidase, partial [Thermomicrobiales bacterium]|nr:peptidase [Thermomicrobiales bacterium]